MYSLFTRLMNMSLVAGIMVLVILILRLCLKKAPRKFVCLLWALVALRLILPFSIGSSLSAFNLLNFKTTETGQVEYFQYNGKTEKPELIFSYPGLVNDNMSPDSMTIGTHTSDVYLPPLTYVWVFGVGCMLTYAAYSYLQLRRETSASIRSDGNIYVCDDIDSPFILGIVSPRIYLPSGMSEETKKSVIAHEKVHIQRRDHWWKPLGYLLLSVYWFNPLLWLAYALLCRDIEAACDEKVIESMDRESISAYSEALLSCAVKRRMITACPVAFGETDVKGRVKNVLNYKKPAFWIICAAVVLCVVAAVCLLTDPADAESGVSHDPVKENYGVRTRIMFDNKVAEGINGILAECNASGGFKLTQAAGGDGPLAAGEYEMLFNKANFPENALKDQLRFDVYVIDPDDSNILVAAGIPLTFYEDMRFELTEKDGVFTLTDALSGEVAGSSEHVFVNYVQNADGTYTTEDGKTYKFLRTLTGRSPNAVCDAYYVVLTNSEDLDFETVNSILLSSTFNPARSESFGIVSLGVIDDSDAPTIAEAPWIWPCESQRISAPFAERVYPVSGDVLFHNEVDIAIEKGSPVVSALAGTVVTAEYLNSKGNCVEILHADGTGYEGEVITYYAHLDEICVSVGDSVLAGEKIGTVGSTGNSTGPHLAFGVKLNGEYVDPMCFYDPDRPANSEACCPSWCREEDKDSFITVFQDEMAGGKEGVCRYVAYNKNSAEYSAVKCVRNGNGVSFSELPDWLNDKNKIQYHDTGLTASLLDRSVLAVKEMLKERGEESYSMSYIAPRWLDAEDFSKTKPEELCYYCGTGELGLQEGSLRESDIYGIISILQISPIKVYLVK